MFSLKIEYHIVRENMILLETDANLKKVISYGYKTFVRPNNMDNVPSKYISRYLR